MTTEKSSDGFHNIVTLDCGGPNTHTHTHDASAKAGWQLYPESHKLELDTIES